MLVPGSVKVIKISCLFGRFLEVFVKSSFSTCWGFKTCFFLCPGSSKRCSWDLERCHVAFDCFLDVFVLLLFF